MYVIYSRYGHIQGIIKNENDVFFTCSIKTTGIGQNPIRRCATKEEALSFTDEHYNMIAKVKFAGLLRDMQGDLD